MLVLDMLVLDMLDSAMLESLPPTLPSATPLLTLPTEQPTLLMLECAPTIWELRSLARHYFFTRNLPKYLGLHN